MTDQPVSKTRNVLYVLQNGLPDEWALVRGVSAGERPGDVGVFRFEDVPDELADKIDDGYPPKQLWQELMALPHDTL